MRVLSFGSKKYVFLAQLYTCLKKYDSDLSVDCISLKDRSRKPVTDAPVFDALIKPRFTWRSTLYFLSSLHRLLLGLLWSLGILILSPREGINSFSFVIGGFFKIGFLQHHLNKYSIIHIHYCTARNMSCVFFLPRGIRIICTYWGSDLFRHQGPAYNFWTRKALNLADVITVPSPEMRETVLSEFGRDLKAKFHYTLFIPEFKLVNLIDVTRDNPDDILKFKSRLDIPENTVVICVGNNASVGNNHLSILTELEKCTADIDSICVVLPLTYGRKKEYCRKLDAYCKQSRLHIRMLHEYMTWEDLALLRIISDIMIMMPESDAMSGALTEAMYAGSVAITAGWLPYGRLRDAGCFFQSIFDFENLPAAVDRILADIEYFKKESLLNKERLKTIYYNEPRLAQAWLDAYSSALTYL